MAKKIFCIMLAAMLMAVFPCAIYADGGVATPAVTQDENIAEEIPPDGNEEQDVKETEEVAIKLNSHDVLQLTVPIDLNFTIDPLELNGRGQIFSDVFEVKNYSDTDIVLYFETVRYIFSNDTDFKSWNAPPEIPFGLTNPSPYKDVFMKIRYLNRDLPDFVITDVEQSETHPLELKAASYNEDGSLSDESMVRFDFSGIVNYMPAVEWKEKDISVHIGYKVADAEARLEKSAQNQEKNHESDTSEPSTDSAAAISEPQNQLDESNPQSQPETSEEEAVEREQHTVREDIPEKEIQSGPESP